MSSQSPSRICSCVPFSTSVLSPLCKYTTNERSLISKFRLLAISSISLPSHFSVIQSQVISNKPVEACLLLSASGMTYILLSTIMLSIYHPSPPVVTSTVSSRQLKATSRKDKSMEFPPVNTSSDSLPEAFGGTVPSCSSSEEQAENATKNKNIQINFFISIMVLESTFTRNSTNRKHCYYDTTNIRFFFKTKRTRISFNKK